MHTAVELILKRMESNPGEFLKGHKRHHKWERIMEKYMDFIDLQDKEILKKKYSEIQMEQMHKDVMAELLYGEEPKENEEDPFATNEIQIARMKLMMKNWMAAEKGKGLDL